MRSIEICAGAGGQALGLEQAGFSHEALVEIDKDACKTLRVNRPNWNIIEGDIRDFSAYEYNNIDLLSGGVPCPPFSVAGKQLGTDDERNLFPEMIRLVSECKPKAIMVENVRGLMDNKFSTYRNHISKEIESQGYSCTWKLVNACEFGVPQSRPRAIFLALRPEYASYFKWPDKVIKPPTVGTALVKEMAANGWEMAFHWAKNANAIAPTLVGGSKKHGGADLGPTRAREAWRKLGVDGGTLAEYAPEKGFVGTPKLTVAMAAIIQGFPSTWQITGKKTAAYRQVGNAFPPPVAKAIGKSIYEAIHSYQTDEKEGASCVQTTAGFERQIARVFS